MGWEQIDALAPVMTSCEQLHLVSNKCSKIFSIYKAPKEHFNKLAMINLEDNNIESWDEVIEFRHLENLQKLILSRNKIPNIYHKDGFKQLFMLSIDKNSIDNWSSIDVLNQFP